MKRILAYVMFVVISFSNVCYCANNVFAEETKTTINENELYARSAVLMDADSGRILYGKAADTPRPNASTTKIMTCILALENGNIDNLVNVSKYASTMPDVQLNIVEGEQYYLKDLLLSLMLESHNDSAVAIAEHIGGTLEGFAIMMNNKAKEIGCKNTHFITPNGLDAEDVVTKSDGSTTKIVHSTTAEDLALIMSYCIRKSPQKDMFLQITRTPSHSFTNQITDENGNVSCGNRSFSCHNHNAFLGMMEGALSGKTGFTGDAGYCYVGALEREDRTYVVALLACGWPYNKNYKWSDTRKLMEYGLANFQKKDFSTLNICSEWLENISVIDGVTENLFEDASVEVYIREENGAPSILLSKDESISVNCDLKKVLLAPVQKNQVVGNITYKLGNEVYWERQLCIRQGIDKRDFTWYFNKVLQEFVKKVLAL